MKEKVSKASVSYHYVGMHATQRCENCSMYKNKTCSLVKGPINPGAWCKEWERK